MLSKASVCLLTIHLYFRCHGRMLLYHCPLSPRLKFTRLPPSGPDLSKQKGQTWIFEYCHKNYHYDALMDFLVALSFSRPVFEDRLHLVYLVNDVLFHR